MTHEPSRASRAAPRIVIVGGGIGGLTTALTLHAAGHTAVVVEQARHIRELGVGINILPPAVAVLAELGVLDELLATGVPTRELRLCARDGTVVDVSARGLAAGHRHPQVSIHRGALQRILHTAVLARLGHGAVLTGHRLRSLTPSTPPQLTFDTATGTDTSGADLVIGADGIHSVVRASLFPDEGPPHWNGALIWRGATEFRPFRSGDTMIIAGGMAAKAVVYPIGPARRDRVLTNWAIVRTIAAEGAPAPRRESWSRTVAHATVLRELHHFAIDDVDLAALVAATDTVYEYPMCDRDPLPSWSTPAVTLLGDAAHPMYPVGSNGATQAIIDADCLATQLADATDISAAIGAYERLRRDATAAIVAANRSGGPEAVIDDYERAHLPPLR